MGNLVIESNQSEQLPSINDDSLDAYFKIHEKVHSKQEKIVKSYKNNTVINFSDISELHYKTIQCIEALYPKKSSVIFTISIYHTEGETEQFTSFENFQSHNITNPNPTSEVVLSYTFSLFNNSTNNFENYKVTCHLRSRIAELKQFESEAPAFLPKKIINGLITTTSQIVVEHSDYVKARTFTAMFDEWIKGCDENASSKVFNQLKKTTNYIPAFGKLTMLILLAACTITSMPLSFFNLTDQNGLTEAIKFLVAYASLFITILTISNILFVNIAEAIDSNLTLSYLNINKGDSKLHTEFNNRNKQYNRTAVINLLGAFIVGILSAWTYDLLKHFI